LEIYWPGAPKKFKTVASKFLDSPSHRNRTQSITGDKGLCQQLTEIVLDSKRRNCINTLAVRGAIKSIMPVSAIEEGAMPDKVREIPRKPNILLIMGDDIGWFNISAYNHGIMGYRTPNIDRLANEGAMFTDWYGQQSFSIDQALEKARQQEEQIARAVGGGVK
jgi:hypothetical protein